MNDTPRPRCQAQTQSGRPCRLPAVAGQDYCHIHIKQQPTPSSAELQAELQYRHQTLAAHPRPDTSPPLFTVEELLELLSQLLNRFSPETQEWLRQGLRHLLASEWCDRQTWQGIGYVLQVLTETQLDMLKRRLSGDYEVDAWGYDPEFVDTILPILGFFFQRYWRVEMTGVEHIPMQGRALLVANHSGVLPMDGAMIAYGIREYHPAHRLVRCLVADWFTTLPFLSMFLNKTGQVVAHPDNGRRLLDAEELVLVFPEGYKGLGKPFKERYQLARFGRGGFVRMALETGTPILPVAVVGAEETYPLLGNAKPIARLLGLPYFPITPTFPWLGLLGAVPLPSKWTIDIGEPIDTRDYDPQWATNPDQISEITDLVRQRLQDQINVRLAERQSVFFG